MNPTESSIRIAAEDYIFCSCTRVWPEGWAQVGTEALEGSVSCCAHGQNLCPPCHVADTHALHQDLISKYSWALSSCITVVRKWFCLFVCFLTCLVCVVSFCHQFLKGFSCYISSLTIPIQQILAIFRLKNRSDLLFVRDIIVVMTMFISKSSFRHRLS